MGLPGTVRYATGRRGGDMRAFATSVYRWLVHRPSYMFLTAGDEQFAAQSPERFARVWWGLMLISLGWGLAATALYGHAWQVFWDYSGILLMPAALVTAAWVVWPYRRAVTALAEALCGREGNSCTAAVAAIVIVLAMAMLGLKSWHPDLPTNMDWYLRWIPPTMFRSLILAPLWGAWAMLIAPKFCKPTGQTQPAVAAMVQGCGAATTAGCMAMLLAATMFAFRVFGLWHLTVPVATILAAVVGGTVLCRRAGGPTRDSLLAANLFTQIVFFLAYLALIR